MATFLLGGRPHYWDCTQGDKYEREYTVKYKAATDRTASTDWFKDDPSNWANTPGLPAVGTSWSTFAASLGTSGGDDWAFRTPYINAVPYKANDEAPYASELTIKFKTADYKQKRCNTNKFNNPLLEPAQIRVGWMKYRRLPDKDRDDKPYRCFSGEPYVGQEIEIDDNHWEVNIDFNILSISLPLVDSLADHLNDSPLWGLPAERVKFSKFNASKIYYGTCGAYARVSMGFEIRKEWTQHLPWKSRMRLAKDGLDPTDPKSWKVEKDLYGENIPVFALDIDGKPMLGPPGQQVPKIDDFEPYPVGNLLSLGIPASF